MTWVCQGFICRVTHKNWRFGLFWSRYHSGKQEATAPTLLSAALPLHPAIRRQRIILQGEIPNPMHPPPGCRFHPRCPQAMPQCRTLEPAWKAIEPGHDTACHLYA